MATESINKPRLFNLILYSNENQKVAYFQQLIQMIVERLPCKVIFIQHDPESSKNELNILQTTIVIGKGAQLISCDQITIQVSGHCLKRVPTVILPHLVPDLPINLFWGQDPTVENEIFPSLASLASRLIFEAEEAACLPEFSRKLLKQIAVLSNPSFGMNHMSVIDMNWARIGGWRRAMVQAFACTEHLNQLKLAKHLTIDYNVGSNTSSSKPNEIQVIYFVTWLASRLKWSFVNLKIDEAIHYITYENEHHHPIEIELRRQNQEYCSPGSLISIELLTASDFHFSLYSKPHIAQIEVNISTPETCDLPFTIPLTHLQKGSSLTKELFYSKTNIQYVEMLQALEHQNWPCLYEV